MRVDQQHATTVEDDAQRVREDHDRCVLSNSYVKHVCSAAMAQERRDMVEKSFVTNSRYITARQLQERRIEGRQHATSALGAMLVTANHTG